MSVPIQCGRCQAIYWLEDHAQGAMVRCTKCSAVLRARPGSADEGIEFIEPTVQDLLQPRYVNHPGRSQFRRVGSNTNRTPTARRSAGLGLEPGARIVVWSAMIFVVVFLIWGFSAAFNNEKRVFRPQAYPYISPLGEDYPPRIVLQPEKQAVEINQAISAYRNEHSELPSYSQDENGRKLHSWRVLILPYLDGGEAFDDLRLDEPWDSDHNLAIFESRPMPEVYSDGDLSEIIFNRTEAFPEGESVSADRGTRYVAISMGVESESNAIEDPRPAEEVVRVVQAWIPRIAWYAPRDN